MFRIAVVGTGYVGLVTGACFAELGNRVTCIDADQSKIDALQNGRIPFYEPGLLELVLRNHNGGRLSFKNTIAEGIADANFIFIAVGTPMGEDGSADLRQVRSAAEEIAKALDHDAIVINKSTVPVETGDLVASIIEEHSSGRNRVTVASNPEFLREGSAIADFMKPDRVVIGCGDQDSVDAMQALYAPLEAPMIVTNVRTAEMIKYTANAFLATKISFINEVANLCERVGADVKDVVAGAGSDRRIGTAFMNPGLGFGGSCFPKDVSALARIAESSGAKSVLLPAVLEINAAQIDRAFEKLSTMLGGVQGKRIGLLGLAFKPNTDDVRESPAIALGCKLSSAGAQIVCHDPVAIDNSRPALPGAAFVTDCYEAANDADAVVVATDWNEYKQLDFSILKKIMKGDVVMDARNLYDPDDVTNQGLRYSGVGRSHRRPSTVVQTALDA